MIIIAEEDKLDASSAQFSSIHGVAKQGDWQKLVPDDNHDWVNQVNPHFNQYLVLGDKKDKAATPMFENYSQGALTARDAWCYNASKVMMECSIRSMIAFFNAERKWYHQNPDHATLDIDTFINSDPTKISWTRALKQDLVKNKALAFTEGEVLISTYRPFSKQWMYYGRRLNEMVYQMPQIYPDAAAENRVICVTGIGARSEFSALIVDVIPNFHTLDSGQCFPLKLYEKTEASCNDDLFVSEEDYSMLGIEFETVSVTRCCRPMHNFRQRIPEKPSAKKIYSITYTEFCIRKTTEPGIATI